MEISADIHLLKIPLPNSSLNRLNAYLVKTKEACMLIDTGWNTEESYNSLLHQLKGLDVKLSDLKYIVVTHAHPDHFGLVNRLSQESPAQLIIHEMERSLVQARYLHYGQLQGDMEIWLRLNGVPAEETPKLQKVTLPIMGKVNMPTSHKAVYGGEHLKIGDFDFEVLWTPGHAKGHICLYEEQRKILFTGDHIIADITPNISLHVQSINNPLAEYINTFKHIEKLNVNLALPAHGSVITDLKQRIKEIKEHHAQRNGEIIATLASDTKTAYQVATELTWAGNRLDWKDMPAISKRFALTETISHLEFLFSKGMIQKNSLQGLMLYSKNSSN